MTYRITYDRDRKKFLLLREDGAWMKISERDFYPTSLMSEKDKNINWTISDTEELIMEWDE